MRRIRLPPRLPNDGCAAPRACATHCAWRNRGEGIRIFARATFHRPYAQACPPTRFCGVDRVARASRVAAGRLGRGDLTSKAFSALSQRLSRPSTAVADSLHSDVPEPLIEWIGSGVYRCRKRACTPHAKYANRAVLVGAKLALGRVASLLTGCKRGQLTTSTGQVYMCGIAGIVRHQPSGVSLHSLGRMAAAIRHRGPDGYGFYSGKKIGLAHVRLSTAEVGGVGQPLTNEDGTIVLTSA